MSEKNEKILEKDYNTDEGKEIYFECPVEECRGKILHEIITRVQKKTTIIDYVSEDQDGNIHIKEKKEMSDISLFGSCNISYKCLTCGKLLFDVKDVNVSEQELVVYLRNNCSQE